ncbi:MAG: outer membrane protein transport protein [Tatlockia sp.]|nr:outer membrane protein transport protein [Tatlockia sp.]
MSNLASQYLKLSILLAWLFPYHAYASFIESTIGTAVVNDATATYHNPAALTLLKNRQLIALNTVAKFNTLFIGQSTQSMSHLTQAGRTRNQTNFYLPSGYLGLPLNAKVTAGLALIANSFNKDLDGNSILRYAQSNSQIENIDFLPALGIKLNDNFSIGAGLNFSGAKFILEPVSGFTSINIPDRQSLNQTQGNSLGGDCGLVWKPKTSTLLGFNFRSANVYRQRGSSLLKTIPPLKSNNHHFKFWTPARAVFSINQFLSDKLGLIGTIQYIQWSIFKTLTLQNVATQIGSRATILTKADVPYHLHNSWVLTLGTHYRATEKCIIRVAGTYNQSPGNLNYQISNGDSFTVGGSIGYDFNKHVSIDASYAHGFFKTANIHIDSARNLIEGINQASRDGISLKLIINL